MRHDLGLERHAVLDQSLDSVRCSCCFVVSATHPTELWMCLPSRTCHLTAALVFSGKGTLDDRCVCVSSCVTICHCFTAMDPHHTPPTWLGAPVLDPRMFTTPAGDNDEKMKLFMKYILQVKSTTIRHSDGLLFRLPPSCCQQKQQSKDDPFLVHDMLLRLSSRSPLKLLDRR